MTDQSSNSRSILILALVGLLVGVGYQRFYLSKRGTHSIFYQDAPNWYNATAEHQELVERQEKCTPTLYESLFVNVSSDVSIAVDVYLPCDYYEEGGYTGEGYPLFFHITRYGRRLSVRWPFSLLFGTSINTRSKLYVNTFVPSGYALMTMDVRGSGASGSSRDGDLLESEIDDYVAVLEWAKTQPWFNQKNPKVASGGISYDGMAAAALAARGLLHAALLVFAPLNVYEELALPGGVPCSGFVHPYAIFTTALETATAVTTEIGPMGLLSRFFFNVIIEGPAPPTMSGSLYGGSPDEKPNKFTTYKHIEEHKRNWKIRDVLRRVQFSDDVAVKKAESNGLTSDYTAAQLGVNPELLEQIVASDVHIMSYSGYYDSGAVRSSATISSAAAKKGKTVHCTIGPWTHGLRRVSSSFAQGRHEPSFLLGIDMLRYMEYALNRNNNVVGLSDDGGAPPVRVFEEQSLTWHSAYSMDWADTTKATNLLVKGKAADDDGLFYSHHDFDENHVSSHTQKLSQADPSQKLWNSIGDEPVALLTPSNAGSSSATTSLPGVFSRWNLIQQILLNSVHTNIQLNDPSIVDGAFAKYTVDLRRGSTNEESRVHFGIPVVRAQVRLRSPGTDASLFFYLLLQDDTKDGDLKYLTETQLRLGHGPLDALDQRDFSSAKFAPLKVDDDYYSLEVGLEPLRFEYRPATQKLVLLVGRRDDANFLVPHPAASGGSNSGQETHAVEIRQVSIDLPTLGSS